MFPKTLQAFLFISATFQAVSVQGSSSSACNNSPSLCSKQYNNVTYLGAHDSPFLRDASTSFTDSGNQYYNSTVQLSAGVRLLTAQVQYPDDSTALHVCHTSCSLLDAGTLSDWLGEVKSWMDANTQAVVTILLVNGASATASELAAAYASSGLDSLAYTPASSSANNTWPTLQSLISNGTRAMNFIADLSDNSGATYLMNEFTYIFENDYDNSQPTDYSCNVNRPSSIANQTSTAISDGYMSLMNHFLYEDQAFGIQTPNATYANITNGPSGSGVGNLGDHADECTALYGKAPTFLLVDFFNLGPAIETADRLNGVSDAVGRTSVPTTALDETSAASFTVPSSWALCLGLGAAFLSLGFL